MDHNSNKTKQDDTLEERKGGNTLEEDAGLKEADDENRDSHKFLPNDSNRAGSTREDEEKRDAGEAGKAGHPKALEPTDSGTAPHHVRIANKVAASTRSSAAEAAVADAAVSVGRKQCPAQSLAEASRTPPSQDERPVAFVNSKDPRSRLEFAEASGNRGASMRVATKVAASRRGSVAAAAVADAAVSVGRKQRPPQSSGDASRPPPSQDNRPVAFVNSKDPRIRLGFAEGFGNRETSETVRHEEMKQEITSPFHEQGHSDAVAPPVPHTNGREPPSSSRATASQRPEEENGERADIYGSNVEELQGSFIEEGEDPLPAPSTLEDHPRNASSPPTVCAELVDDEGIQREAERLAEIMVHDRITALGAVSGIVVHGHDDRDGGEHDDNNQPDPAPSKVKRYIIIGVAVIAVLGIVIGVIAGSSGGSASPAPPVAPTSVSSKFPPVAPTSVPSKFPFISPTATPTGIPSTMPTTTPTHFRYIVEDQYELVGLVDEYLGATYGGLLTSLPPIEMWDVSRVASFASLFSSSRNPLAAQYTGGGIPAWNVQSGVDFNFMFRGAEKFDADLSSWDVSRVTSMYDMFYGAASFQGIGLESWNVAFVQDMKFMFAFASNFDVDLSSWDVSRVTTMSNMFYRAFSFQGRGLESWNVASVQDMSHMFYGALNFDVDLSSWDVSSVITMESMFSQAFSFQGRGLESWNVAKDMSKMFHRVSNVDVDLSSWNVSSVTTMQSMFSNASSFQWIGVESWNVASVQDMSFMFYLASNFDADLSSWDVSRVTTMLFMFHRATFQGIGLESWNVASVQDMSFMFDEASNFDVDLSSWDVSSVTSMGFMFYNATSFNRNLCSWGNLISPMTSTISMFSFTSCPDTSDPDTFAGTPFCFECN